MKNIKIFPKDWLQLHPYKQSTPVDSYYTGIANRIYDIMEKTELVNSFEGDLYPHGRLLRGRDLRHGDLACLHPYP